MMVAICRQAGRQVAAEGRLLHPHQPATLCRRISVRCNSSAEFCERGSLADLLARARHDPAAAATLPWARRLSMVGGLLCHQLLPSPAAALYPAINLLGGVCDAVPMNGAKLPCRRWMPRGACCTCTPAPCRCCAVFHSTAMHLPSLQALDAARGMLYLHSRPVPVLHRDLKSPNLLVDAHFRAKAR